MSSEIINESLIESIIEKIKKEYSLRDNKEVAQLIGISAQNFSLKKKRGTLINDMLAWAIEKNQDLNYLFKIISDKPQRQSEVDGMNQLLTDVNEWLNEEEKHKDAEFRILFRQQMIRAFFDYEKWIKERKVSLGSGEDLPARKIA